MSETILNNNSYKVDPSQTTLLRNAFASDMKKRFNELISIIYKAIVERDCFGSKKTWFVKAYQMELPGERAFAYTMSQEKIEAFMKWLKEQVDKGILTVSDIQQLGVGLNEYWTNKYITDSYKRGIIRARYEMKKAGMDVPSIEDTGIDIWASTHIHLDRLGILYARVFSDLKGITDTMDSQISRVLAQGIADGDGPLVLARKLNHIVTGSGEDLGITDTLGRFIPAKRRAEMLARTEVIRAHHKGMIQEYRNWEVENVKILIEYMTSGDDRVCDKCASLQGNIYTLDEAENLIPLHPLCRCSALPYIEGISTKISTEIMPKGKLAGTKR